MSNLNTILACLGALGTIIILYLMLLGKEGVLRFVATGTAMGTAIFLAGRLLKVW